MKNRLAQVLIEKEISPTKLRKHLEVDRSNVYRWLTNATQPSDENKKRISEYVGIPIGDIFFQDNDARCAVNIRTGTDA